ncbi:hypothetical protein CRENBAI_008948 [Crenichthys baileyi]|uniref:Uncharacterized protein n=1 Tax=Crenichthys baileyi TaxID=28760 RepID=A0AAV9R949_9TELE
MKPIRMALVNAGCKLKEMMSSESPDPQHAGSPVAKLQVADQIYVEQMGRRFAGSPVKTLPSTSIVLSEQRNSLVLFSLYLTLMGDWKQFTSCLLSPRTSAGEGYDLSPTSIVSSSPELALSCSWKSSRT